MKIIPLGLQCSVPEGIKRAGLREYSYAFDWLWTPSKTTYMILNILINEGVEKALDFMTTGYSYYIYNGNEHYSYIGNKCTNLPIYQMNSNSGLGITHYDVEVDKDKFKRRLERLYQDIKTEELLLIYADAANPYSNYHLDDIEYGLDATEDLIKIHELIYQHNPKVKIVYFCWNKRIGNSELIEYIPYDFKNTWHEVSDIIKNYLEANL